MNSSDPAESTERYVDELLGPGMGKRHLIFLGRIRDPSLRELVLRFHAVEADTAHVTVEENYLIGVCVLVAQGQLRTAAMFAKLLRRIGTSSERILAAVARVAMWAGGLPVTEASLVIQKALSEYDEDPERALAPWFPEPPAE